MRSRHIVRDRHADFVRKCLGVRTFSALHLAHALLCGSASVNATRSAGTAPFTRDIQTPT